MLLKMYAASWVMFLCSRLTPVGVPSSSTPRYSVPPLVLANATTLARITESSIGPDRSLLNFTRSDSSAGIRRTPIIAPDPFIDLIIDKINSIIDKIRTIG